MPSNLRTGSWQQGIARQTNSTPLSNGPSISTMLNASPGGLPDYATRIAAMPTHSAGSNAKMTLHYALSPMTATATSPGTTAGAQKVSVNLTNAVLPIEYPAHRSPAPSSLPYFDASSSEYAQRGEPSVNHNEAQVRATGARGGRPVSSKRISSSRTTRDQWTANLAVDQMPDTIKKENGNNDHQSNGKRNWAFNTPTMSSPSFSEPNARQPSFPRYVSIETASLNNSSDEDDDQDKGRSEMFGPMTPFRGSREATTPPLGHNAMRRGPVVQRERNRVAATKCRAKTKAAISKLEEDERLVSDRRDTLSAEKSALMGEVLRLRMELLKHSHCQDDANIQNYLRNAARMIGESGGRNPIWGPDGSGTLWPTGHRHARRG
ncbi:bZIP transcription factor, bZIP-1 [Niveomyces insectorum RCEF 264]|uniref:BZIP transcription factor, bZIP-1 n=1 Tax=Niveomyces insectorum RCEF 264 TaxID=1081102 RepID=A0A162J8K1_9HYPO|nr:bZIP transcription factor, bZIP-1 [Niveomyces insectorum RCEF 264]